MIFMHTSLNLMNDDGKNNLDVSVTFRRWEVPDDAPLPPQYATLDFKTDHSQQRLEVVLTLDQLRELKAVIDDALNDIGED